MPTAAGSLSLRPARAEDCRLVWEWANDALVRQVSFSSDPIPWEDHQGWFARRLADPQCDFFIVVAGVGDGADRGAGDGAGEAVGQVRFDRAPEGAVISVSIAPGRRGGGLGSRAIELACAALRRKEPRLRVVAYIRPDNLASQRAFSRAGFGDPEPVDYQGKPAVRQVLEPGQQPASAP